MKLLQIQRILEAEILCGSEYLEKEAETACGADLMSDVLAFTKEKAVLLTGLTNIQAIRTAEISDLTAIVFVRGKRPGPEVVQLAEKKGIPLLLSGYPMFESCGKLYANGLKGCAREGAASE